jgi:hypothetical protein
MYKEAAIWAKRRLGAGWQVPLRFISALAL